MKRNNVDAALIIEVSKPIAYGQYQFEKGDKLTYDVNSNLFIYRSESYSEDEDGTETTSIIAFGVDPDFVLDNADHFTCLIKKGILNKVEDDDKVEDDTDNSHDDTDKPDDKPAIDTDEQGDVDTPNEAAFDYKTDYEFLIDHADKLSNEEIKNEVIKAIVILRDSLECYDLALRKRFIGRGIDDCDGFDVERRIYDTISNLSWTLRGFNEDKKRATEGEKKKSLNDCCGEAYTSAR